MKTKYFLTAVLFLSMSAFAQKEMKDVKVPKVVNDAFSKLYPKATDVKWDKEGKEEFEAGFKENGNDISVVIDEDGKLMATETTIQISELPNSIAPYVEKKYAGYTISGAAKIVDSKGNVTFEAEVSKDKIKKDLIFDKNGKLVVKKHTKNEKEEKEDHDKD